VQAEICSHAEVKNKCGCVGRICDRLFCKEGKLINSHGVINFRIIITYFHWKIMCVPSIRNCFCDLDGSYVGIWNHFLKCSFFIGGFDKNELPAGPKFNVVQNTQDISHYTFWTEYTDFGKTLISSPYILWALSPRLKSRTIFKIIQVKCKRPSV
jgi:hypothetical protein